MSDQSARHRRSTLVDHLRALGLREGGMVLVHAALRSVGPVFGGRDALVGALLAAVGVADPARLDLDRHLACPGDFEVHLHHPERPFCLERDCCPCLHGPLASLLQGRP